MDTNKILSADFLDLLFDNRNKDYGAYELRKTYQSRVTRALIFTGIFVGLTFTGVVLASKLEPKEKSSFIIKEWTLEDIKPDEKEPEPIPEPIIKPEPVQVQSAQFTQIRVVEDEEVIQPPPTQDDLLISKISDENNTGVVDEGIVSTNDLDDGKDIITDKIVKEPEIFTKVEIDAKFDGNWEKFLVRNLNAQTPIDNNAPPGNYRVIMQFVVDIDGTVSDIKALSNLGYGLEQEAIRVLKKATKWEPAIQNGRKVKAYRTQSITFQVTEE
jgi:periplasmic protein TonB